jgi:hypothetical protein
MPDDPAFLCVSDKVIHNIVCGPQLSNLLLHCVLEYTFLLLDKGTLFFVIGDALVIFSPIATPPVAPSMSASCAAVSSGSVTLFSSSGALGAGS